jgi:signal transduction histidine kinase
MEEATRGGDGGAPPAATRDATPTLRSVVRATRALAGAAAAAILLYDRDADLFVPVVPSVAEGLDEAWLQRQGLPAAQSVALRAVQSGDILEIDDTATLPDLEFPLLAGKRRPAALGVTPLAVEGTVVGVLEVYYAQPNPHPLDRAAARAFADLAGRAIAVEHAHAREQVLRARLEALDAVTSALSTELALDRLLRLIVEIAAQVAGARYGALGVVGEDGYLTGFITTGLTPEERALLGPLPRGHGLLGVLIHEGEPLRVANIARDPRRIGFPPHHPPMTSLLGVPIRVHQQIVGDLYLTDKIGAPAFSAEDQHLIELLAAHAGIAIENARLYARLRELTLAHERERFGRELHDGIIQDLYALTLQMDDIAEDLPDAALRARLEGLTEQLSGVIGDVRAYIHGLHDGVGADQSLRAGLEALVREICRRTGLQTTYTVDGAPLSLPEATTHDVLQIAREALANVAKHAQATHTQVRLAYAPGEVTLTVQDDGRGFDPAADPGPEHQGLRNLRARAAEAGGRLRIESAPGGGTTLVVTLPAPPSSG